MSCWFMPNISRSTSSSRWHIGVAIGNFINGLKWTIMLQPTSHVHLLAEYSHTRHEMYLLGLYQAPYLIMSYENRCCIPSIVGILCSRISLLRDLHNLGRMRRHDWLIRRLIFHFSLKEPLPQLRTRRCGDRLIVRPDKCQKGKMFTIIHSMGVLIAGVDDRLREAVCWLLG